MKQIICNMNMYDLHQLIFLAEDGVNQKQVGIASIDGISEMLVECCKKYDTYSIHLFGNAEYLSPVVEQIEKIKITNYAYENIIIEVN